MQEGGGVGERYVHVRYGVEVVMYVYVCVCERVYVYVQ